MIDLAGERLGGAVLAANDEFFAPKERLIAAADPVFTPGVFTDRGKLMDGWETRRRRDRGSDWALVRLGVAGVVREVVIDTRHFTGNYPESAGVEVCALPAPATTGALEAAEWVEVLPRVPLTGDAVQRLPSTVETLATHARLRIFPDGGIARLRLRGEAVPDVRRIGSDLAAVEHGGEAIDCSDRHYSAPGNLLLPGKPRDMGDGWETRRRRGPGQDWAVLRLAGEGTLTAIEVDTSFFKGNAPATCALDGGDGVGQWWPLLPDTALLPHARHRFDLAAADRPASHVRFTITPDGGVARLRVHGALTPGAHTALALRRLHLLPSAAAAEELLACCGATRWAEQMAAQRPFADLDAVLTAADRTWAALGHDDWRAAFAAHPPLGSRVAVSRWSAQEQAGAAAADDETLLALDEGNRAYAERFGTVFLFNATGRTAAEMLTALRQRLDNDPAEELPVAAEQQRQITAIRLRKLLVP